MSDFLLFVDVFGARQGDEGYKTRFDLDGNGTIGISDFLIFANNFGKEVPSDDRAVLVALYGATDGPNWTKRPTRPHKRPADLGRPRRGRETLSRTGFRGQCPAFPAADRRSVQAHGRR